MSRRPLGRRLLASTLTSLALAAAAPADARAARCDGPACGGTLMLIGTHTGGPGQGIFAARLDPRTGALASLGLAAEIERPTWLESDPKRGLVFSVGETGNDGTSQGGVYALSADRGTGRLSAVSRVDSGGGGATYLDYAPRLSTVFVANYGSGSVAAIPVSAGGRLSAAASVAQDTGSGPHKRQRGPHAHAAVVDPTGRFVLVPDLGADRVFVYRWDAGKRALTPAMAPLAFPAGSGPRHLVFSRDGRFAFVDTELTGEVWTLRWDARAGTLTTVSRVALDSTDFTGTRSASELALSPDGRVLYVGNRGANQIQAFAIDRASGALGELQRIECGGTSPWSFAIDTSGRWLIVANEASSNLSEFAIDPATGRLTATGNRLDVPKPVALSFLP